MSSETINQVMDRISDDLLIQFEQITRFGFERYQQIPAELRIDLSPRAQAACIYDFMMTESERRFDGRADIRPITMRGLKVWAVEDHTLVRLKKMDASGLKCNYRTKQTKEYDRGTSFAEFPPEAIRLTVGYFADAFSSSIERVQVAYQRGTRIDWCAAILPEDQRVEGQKIWTDVTMQGRIAGFG
ncbi:hypothetical protein C7S18_02975 [Ahniella affigens]|uniref:Uncharacterized protein n=1 Tax=Ahniella affigens TaxID=2021234 RepID=A0A2P1PN16_9GAMM|nr:hypothetical protein [Ahniella affigens]AVP96218.1 hypothetical protein C7S18_02975 [Ahniella affigens]